MLGYDHEAICRKRINIAVAHALSRKQPLGCGHFLQSLHVQESYQIDPKVNKNYSEVNNKPHCIQITRGMVDS